MILDILAVVHICNKMEHFRNKSDCGLHVVKHLKRVGYDYKERIST